MESGGPQRTCVGCRRRTNQALLIRISRNPNGEVGLFLEKNRTGRGAYIHSTPECIEAALKGDRIGRAIKSSIKPEEKEALREALNQRLLEHEREPQKN
jgi:predicted RNA-binding protein YlxR (DUF448 family)